MEARMLGLPFWIFWILVFLARGELGLKGIALAVAVWGALLAGSLYTDMPAYVFVAAQAPRRLPRRRPARSRALTARGRGRGPCQTQSAPPLVCCWM